MLPKAYEVARKARELLPNDPSTADTLGWILYKRGEYTWALSLLQESANSDRLSDNPEVQFHLGMTYYMINDEARAGKWLRRAISSTQEFAGGRSHQSPRTPGPRSQNRRSGNHRHPRKTCQRKI
jgi:tetratricopeptide (TPR) repeat protein